MATLAKTLLRGRILRRLNIPKEPIKHDEDEKTENSERRARCVEVAEKNSNAEGFEERTEFAADKNENL
jgi:hypothetical protein